MLCRAQSRSLCRRMLMQTAFPAGSEAEGWLGTPMGNSSISPSPSQDRPSPTACSGRADPSAPPAAADKRRAGSCFQTETKIIFFWRLQKAKNKRQYLHFPVMCHSAWVSHHPSCGGPAGNPVTGGGCDSPDGIRLSNVTSNMGH